MDQLMACQPSTMMVTPLPYHSYLLIEPQHRWGVVILMNINGVAGALVTFPHLQAGIAYLLSGQAAPAAGLTVTTSSNV